MLMRFRPLMLLLALYFASAPAVAGLDINAHGNAAQVTYYYYSNPSHRDMVVDMGLLYIKEEDRGRGGGNNNQNNTMALHTGLLIGNDSIRLGGRLFLANPDGGDVLALALGGKGKIQFSRRLSLGIFVHYAPESLTTMDALSYRELGVRFNIHFARTNKFYVGYRNIEVKIDPGYDLELDNEVHVGLDLGIF